MMTHTTQRRTTTGSVFTPLDDDQLRGPQQDIAQGPGEKGSIVGSAELQLGINQYYG